MSRILFAAGILLILNISTAQAADPPSMPNSMPIDAPRYVAVSKSAPGSVGIEPLTISLIELDDKRCGADKQCENSGYVTAKFKISKPGAGTDATIVVTTAGNSVKLPEFAVYDSYRIHLGGYTEGVAHIFVFNNPAKR